MQSANTITDSDEFQDLNQYLLELEQGQVKGEKATPVTVIPTSWSTSIVDSGLPSSGETDFPF